MNQELLESQILGLTRRKNSIDGKPTSLHDLGYSSIGLDDGWQACGQGVNGSYHDENGNPLVDKKKFPSLIEMTARGHAVNVTMGWYGELNALFPQFQPTSVCTALIVGLKLFPINSFKYILCSKQPTR